MGPSLVAGRQFGLLFSGQLLVRVILELPFSLTTEPWLTTEDDITLSTSLFGYLLLSRGIGNIASTPISNALLRSNSPSPLLRHQNKTGFDVGEGRFEDLILYAGTCFAAASVIAVIGWGMEKSRAQRARLSA